MCHRHVAHSTGCCCLCATCSLLAAAFSSAIDTVFRSLKILAFKQNDFRDKYEQFYAEVPQLVADGKIVYDETVYKGLDQVGAAFLGLFKGQTAGKTVVLVD